MHLTLHLTRDCNMACSYCYAAPSTEPEMSSEVAFGALELGARVRQCERERGRQPTFVGLNYYDIGDGARVVDRLNGVG